MIGWKLVGFPGVAANYATTIGKNEPYDVAPVDLGALRARVPVDEHGHPIHQNAAGVIRPTTAPVPSPSDRQTADAAHTKTTFFV